MAPKKNPHAVALGRKGGEATSERKADAARENGRKGGRPLKVKPARPEWGHKSRHCVYCGKVGPRVVVVGGYAHRRCIPKGVVP